MLRIIVKICDAGQSANCAGGETETRWKTFDVSIPDLEKYLSTEISYGFTQVAGVEVIAEQPEVV